MWQYVPLSFCFMEQLNHSTERVGQSALCTELDWMQNKVILWATERLDNGEVMCVTILFARPVVWKVAFFYHFVHLNGQQERTFSCHSKNGCSIRYIKSKHEHYDVTYVHTYCTRICYSYVRTYVHTYNISDYTLEDFEPLSKQLKAHIQHKASTYVCIHKGPYFGWVKWIQ